MSEEKKHCLWLLHLLNRKGGLSKEEIDSYWRMSHCGERCGNRLSPSTFHYWIKSLNEKWGFEITYSRAKGTYQIANLDENDIFVQWMMNTLTATEIIRKWKALRKWIHIDEVMSGEKWLDLILTAMEEKKVIDITYQRYDMKERHYMEIKPYWVKAYKQRWYVIGESSRDPGKIRSHALDRIVELKIMDKKYVRPKDLDYDKLFEGVIGVWIGTDLEIQRVRVKVTQLASKYLTSKPIHKSQRIVKEAKGKGWVQIEWRVKPTPDFIAELRSWGKALKVVEPEWVKEEV